MSEINSKNVFSEPSNIPNFAESAYDLVDEIPDDALVTALGFSSLLAEVLTDEQKAKLTPWERAALEHLHNLGDEVGLEDVGSNLRD